MTPAFEPLRSRQDCGVLDGYGLSSSDEEEEKMPTPRVGVHADSKEAEDVEEGEIVSYEGASSGLKRKFVDSEEEKGGVHVSLSD